MDISLSPGLLLVAGGLLLPLLPWPARSALVVGAPLAALYAIWQIPRHFILMSSFMGYSILPVYAHPFSHIFATVFALAALGGGIFALGTRARTTELASAFVYAGSAIGVTFSGDLLSFFIYWEIMAIGSTLVIWSAGTEPARKAGLRYAAIHFLGGVILLAGIAAHIMQTGDIAMMPFALHFNLSAYTLPAWLIFIGVLVNCAAPPFSAWLADAYPETSPSGMVFLSAFTTKTAVFALITLFPANPILIPIGLCMVFYGIIYAMLENDMRRILAYSIVNQVGFMVTGIGIGTDLALYGAATHAFCHIIYKALLLMSAGSVLHQTGKRKCSELGGLYHSMPLTAVCGIIGALAISAFPFTSGFVSKSLISSAAADKGLVVTWFLLAAASAGVFLHAGIKFPWFVFFQRDSFLRPKEPPLLMRLAMLAFAALCILPALWPEKLYALLPALPKYQPNTPEHIVTQLQLLLFSGLAFFLMLPWLQRTNTISLDFDWLYRVPLNALLKWLEKFAFRFRNRMVKELKHLLAFCLEGLKSVYSPEGTLARNVQIGDSVIWVGVMLSAYLILYYSVG